MKKQLSVLIIILLMVANAHANDTTSLYRERIGKLKELSQWLYVHAKDEVPKMGPYFQYDSIQDPNWKIYDTAITLFYNRRMMDSIYRLTGGDQIFSYDMKVSMTKAMLASFNYLSHRMVPDSLHFRPVAPEDDYEPTEADLLEMRNVVEEYVLINGESFRYLEFYFEPGTSKLISFLLLSMDDREKIETLNSYLKNLKKRK